MVLSREGVAVLSAGIDQLIDLALGQVLAGAQLRIGWAAAFCNIYFGIWRESAQNRFCHVNQARRWIDLHCSILRRVLQRRDDLAA